MIETVAMWHALLDLVGFSQGVEIVTSKVLRLWKLMYMKYVLSIEMKLWTDIGWRLWSVK